MGTPNTTPTTATPSHTASTEAGAIAAIVSDVLPEISSLPHPQTGENFPVLVTKAGLESLKRLQDERRTAPEARVGVARLQDLDSFIAHTNRFKDADSALFADTSTQTPSITAVLDYHRAGSEGAPRNGKHRSTYAFPLSKEWKAWTGIDGQQISQGEFSAFLEDHINDVADPVSVGEAAREFAVRLGFQLATPGRLLEVAKGLTVQVGNRVANHTNLSSGEVEFHFSTSHADAQGKSLQVPSAFVLAIPVFDRGDLFPIGVRLRYRVVEQNVKWSFSLHRADRALDFAISEAVHKVEDQTELPLYRGLPEA